MYGKITEQGKLLIFQGHVAVLDGQKYINPTPQILKKLGYKPIVEAQSPTVPTGMSLTVDYVDDSECIKTVYGLSGGAI